MLKKEYYIQRNKYSPHHKHTEKKINFTEGIDEQSKAKKEFIMSNKINLKHLGLIEDKVKSNPT